MAGSGKRKQGARVGKRDRKAGVRAGKRDRKPGARIGKRDRTPGARFGQSDPRNRHGFGDPRLRIDRVRLDRLAPLPMPTPGIDVVTEGWEIFEHHHEGWDSYGYVGGVTWASKITKPLPDLQRVVQEVTERKRAAEMQDDFEKFLKSDLGFFLLARHGQEARTATASRG